MWEAKNGVVAYEGMFAFFGHSMSPCGKISTITDYVGPKEEAKIQEKKYEKNRSRHSCFHTF